MQGRGTFNQGTGRDAFNKAFGGGNDAFSQAIGGNTFGQASEGSSRGRGTRGKRTHSSNQQFGRGKSDNAFDAAFSQGDNTNQLNKRGGTYKPGGRGGSSNAFNNPQTANTMFGKTSARGGSTFNNNSTGRGRGRGGAQPSGRGGRSAFDQAFGKPTFNKKPQTDRPTPFGQSNSNTSVFGQSSQMNNSSTFGNNAFNQPIDNSQSQPVFGQTPAPASPFGQPQTSQSVFNQQPPVTNNAFNSAFGNTGFNQPVSESPFGQRQQPEHNTAFNQAFGNTGFNSTTDNGQQLQPNSAFNQAFGNTALNQPIVVDNASPKAFNQTTGFNQPSVQNSNTPTNTFNQAFGNTGFKQSIDNSNKAPQAFNQAFGNTGFNTPKAAEKSATAFDKAFGGAGFNKPKAVNKAPAAFDQAFGNSGFDQPMTSDNTPKTFTKKSHSFNQAFDNGAAVPTSAQPKRTPLVKSTIASRIGGNTVSTTKGKGGIAAQTTGKKAVNTTQVASTFQRKPNKKPSEVSSAPKDSGNTSAADRAARFGSTSKSVLYDQVSFNSMIAPEVHNYLPLNTV